MLCFSFALLAAACGTSSKPLPTDNAERTGAVVLLSRQDRIEVFENVWTTINDEYYDPSFHGVNWQEVHDRYRPRVDAAKDDVEFYRLFEVMLAELRDAHTLFNYPRSPADNTFQPAGSVGISLGEVSAHARRKRLLYRHVVFRRVTAILSLTDGNRRLINTSRLSFQN